MDSWRELANAFANERTLFSLYASYQRSLAQTLVLSATGMRDSEMSYQYVKYLTSHMTAYLVELSGRNDLKKVAEQPDIILLVSCLLERLRGVAIATEPRTQKAIYEIGFSVMNPVLTLLEVYKHESAVVYLLLRFVVDWVDGQIIYLEAHETAVAVGFCMSLLQLYSSHNIGKISLSISKTLRSEEDTERYKDIRVLLQLLASLCSKDLIDFSSEPIEAHGTNISQVVYMGLHIVTPLISLDLLKYPKLCHCKNRSKHNNKQFILAPYHQGNHWLLLVICLRSKNVYVLDPLACDRTIELKASLNIVHNNREVLSADIM